MRQLSAIGCRLSAVRWAVFPNVGRWQTVKFPLTVVGCLLPAGHCHSERSEESRCLSLVISMPINTSRREDIRLSDDRHQKAVFPKARGTIPPPLAAYKTHRPLKGKRLTTFCASPALLQPLLSLTHWIFRSLMLPYKSSSLVQNVFAVHRSARGAADWRSGPRWSIISALCPVHPFPLRGTSPQGETRK